MGSDYLQNCMTCLRFMRRLGTFTIPDVHREMRQWAGKNGCITIGAHQTIREFADVLAESGVLQYLDGQYTWIEESGDEVKWNHGP